jgi:hypothetical protein
VRLRIRHGRADDAHVLHSDDHDILMARFARIGIHPVVTGRLECDDCTEELRVPADHASVHGMVQVLVAQLGALLDAGSDTVAIVRTGFLRINPTVIRIRCTDEGDGTTRVHVRGTAKEGLIRQHGGHQAVREFIARLATLVPGEWTADWSA